MGIGIEVQGVQGRNPQATAVDRIGKVVVGASADFVKQQDVNIDDEKLLDFQVLRQKESIGLSKNGAE